MNIANLLPEKKSAILRRWYDSILHTYAIETSDFLKNQKNQFANPVGHTIYRGMDGLLDEFFIYIGQKGQGGSFDKVSAYLDDIIRIRAIQDFTPSRAIAFIFFLKNIIKEELSSEISRNGMHDELLYLEHEIDRLSLISFDIYMKCREKIYDLKANELRNMTSKLVERANEIFNSKQGNTNNFKKGGS